jgi:hypothetical protein
MDFSIRFWGSGHPPPPPPRGGRALETLETRPLYLRLALSGTHLSAIVTLRHTA